MSARVKSRMPETFMDASTPAAATSDEPAVTVVVATYNRSNILRYAISTVLSQTRADWELLVVGDGCTDDSAAVVAGFDDPRIRYVDLSPRVGDQSGPTNAGIALARGRYIALLNHDDLWFPDHLERALSTLDETRADLTFTLQLEADPDSRWRINASYPDGHFDPIVHPNASTWVFRRELAAKTGPLRHRKKVFTYPTRDWLWRAYRNGASLAATPAVTVLVVSATTRRNVYAERQWREHASLWQAMRDDPRFREQRITEAWLHPAPTHLKILGLGVLLRAMAARAIGRVAQGLGLDPEIVYCYYKFPRRFGFVPERGAVIRELYRRRGLSEMADSVSDGPSAVNPDASAGPRR
jgi:glycosyltransferase involved in cell wall biosynthesis